MSFAEGEKILAYHGPCLYEAKILKTEQRPDLDSTRLGATKLFYFIHYTGWKDRHNEWVEENRLAKFNEENLQKQAKLKEEFGDKPRKMKPKDKDKEKKSSKTNSGKRRKRDEDQEVESAPGTVKFDLVIPKDLQRRMFEDWDQIVRQKMLIPLPRVPNVESVLDQFFKSQQPPKEGDDEIHAGLRGYFDAALGSLLLYKFERVQYFNVQNEPALLSKPASQIYGVEHLLRLLVKIPELIIHVELEEESREQLRQTITQLLIFLSQNASLVTSSKPYIAASASCIFS